MPVTGGEGQGTLPNARRGYWRAPPRGYLEIGRAVRLLELGDCGIWIASKLHEVDHPAAMKAAARNP